MYMTKTSLKVTKFEGALNHASHEEEVLKYWDDTRAFERSVSERPENKPYVFYDGPPFATGLPHYGHLLASTAKDVVPRYWTMRGYRVERTWGWDCHGIPIENMIEGELGLKGGKKGIEEYGVGNFNAACRAAILRFDQEWKKTITRLGRWVDMDHSYKTMDKTFMESVWWAFKSLHDKGLIKEGKKVILYCPRCSTPLSNFEIAMDNSYKEIQGESTVYKYKIKGEPDTYFLAWSTTPWNKLATPALAVSPDLTYVKVKQGDEFYLLAENTLSILNPQPGYKVVEKFRGQDLEKYEFELHYDFYPHQAGERTGVVVADPFVTADEGTGVVTLAVYGEEDYRVMSAHHIQQIEHVDSDGKLKPEVTPWAGMFMLKVNPLVNKDLMERGLIYKDELRLHSVPVCYRCETRLYHAPVPAWFIDIQKLKPELIAQNQSINWYPAHLKHGRFGKGLETAPDWNISRSRYWGTPMPVWVGKSGQRRIIGSVEELKQWAVDQDRVANLTDIHREFLDDLEIYVDDDKKETGRRIPEVFDCWVESGSMPFASVHYPFENKQVFDSRYPAQYIVEYIAQTRAWFYTLHVMSVALFGKPAFENAVTTGTILAEDGSKMSKSKKNYPDPAILIDKYGVDSLRLYLMSSPVMKGENLNFKETEVDEIRRNVMNIWWNVFAFYELVGGQATTLPPVVSHVLDRWILSRLSSLRLVVTSAMDGYDVVTAARALIGFVRELSNWYVRLSRDRLRLQSDSRAVLGYVLRVYSLLMAPFAPFMSERIFQSLPGAVDSVHLQLWPEPDLADEELEHQMAKVMQVVEKGNSLRKSAGIRLRQPLSSLTTSVQLSQELQDLLRNELNVKEVLTVKSDETQLTLDTSLTPELIEEGRARDLMRDIQGERKKLKLKPNIQIRVELPDWPLAWEEAIKAKVGAASLVRGQSLKIYAL